MIRFECDYLEGAAPQILEAIAQANYEQNPGYGCDPHTGRACELIREACKTKDIAVCFVVGGTQANLTVIGAALKIIRVSLLLLRLILILMKQALLN